MDDLEGKDIDQVLIGTCTYGRLEDIEIAERIIGNLIPKIAPQAILFIYSPLTPQQLKAMLNKSTCHCPSCLASFC